MICHKRKFIFIHVPRTGGTSIEYQGFKRQLGVDEKFKHLSLTKTKKQITKQQFSEYFKFSFVRNPWDLMISKYCANYYRKIGHQTDKSLLYFLENFYIPANEAGVTFHDYFNPEQMDFVGRFETRAKDLEYISSKIKQKLDPGFSVAEKEVQRSCREKKHYTEYYDDETRKIVAERYARDIEYFGYKFGE